MLALKDLWPDGPLGDDQKVYDYILEGIKTKNYGVEIVTSAFVEDLKKLLHLKGPVDWVGRVLPEAKLKNKWNLFFDLSDCC